ncbi:PREDICTED: putative gustatory receptor 28a, partial [Nicrophorus vespilloides]|uniref:Gustatory receptor n=1 Tax=Nicrophorus vespilloides TaxID=110193 RepID=A0ABM1MYC9_NICVS
ILNVVYGLNRMDSELHHVLLSVDVRGSYKKTSRYLKLTIFGTISYIIVCFCLDVVLFWEKDFWYSSMLALAFICPKLITTFVIIQFCFLNAMLKMRFELINLKLANVTRTIDTLNCIEGSHICLENVDKRCNSVNPTFPKVFSSWKLVDVVDGVRRRHYRLCDICSELNSAYSVQILFTSLQVFVTLLASLFYCIKGVTTNEELPDILVPYTLNVAFLSLSQIGAVAFVCSRTYCEARKTGSIIHRVVPYTNDLEVELLYFSIQLLHHNVDFTACRMFKLDESLVLSMVGIICTYLVIVVQFEFASQDNMK